MLQTTTAEVRLDQGKAASSGAVWPSDSLCWLLSGRLRSNFVAARLDEAENHADAGAAKNDGAWSLTSLREKLMKIGAKGSQPRPVRHFPDSRGRGTAMFREILMLIVRLRTPPAPA